MTLTIMGSGTSHGIPVIACDCEVCRSDNPKDKRMRSSALIQDEETCIVIDTGPEFRIQALKFGIKKLDAVLVTHSHADHIHGLDDVRVFSNEKTVQDKSSKKDKKESKSESKLSGDVIKSPIVGTFYRSPSPDSPAYVQKGAKIKKGDPICIIEAIKGTIENSSMESRMSFPMRS